MDETVGRIIFNERTLDEDQARRIFEETIKRGGKTIELEEKINQPLMNNGWVCPKCGSVYNPNVKECGRCSPKSLGLNFG